MNPQQQPDQSTADRIKNAVDMVYEMNRVLGSNKIFDELVAKASAPQQNAKKDVHDILRGVVMMEEVRLHCYDPLHVSLRKYLCDNMTTWDQNNHYFQVRKDNPVPQEGGTEVLLKALKKNNAGGSHYTIMVKEGQEFTYYFLTCREEKEWQKSVTINVPESVFANMEKEWQESVLLFSSIPLTKLNDVGTTYKFKEALEHLHVLSDIRKKEYADKGNIVDTALNNLFEDFFQLLGGILVKFMTKLDSGEYEYQHGGPTDPMCGEQLGPTDPTCGEQLLAAMLPYGESHWLQPIIWDVRHSLSLVSDKYIMKKP